jgi:hypothetical protein
VAAEKEDSLMTATGKCGYKMGDGTVCGKPTNQSWPWGKTIFYFCGEHVKAGAEQVTGRKFKHTSGPKDKLSLKKDY